MASSCTELGVGGIPQISVVYADSLGSNKSHVLGAQWLLRLFNQLQHMQGMITRNITNLRGLAAQTSTAIIPLEFLCHGKSLALMSLFALHHEMIGLRSILLQHGKLHTTMPDSKVSATSKHAKVEPFRGRATGRKPTMETKV